MTNWRNVNLAGFTWPELLTLTHHWQYAAFRCQQELAALRRSWPGSPRSGPGRPVLTFQHWASLSRDYHYLTALVNAVEGVVDGQSAAIYQTDRLPPVLDLPDRLSTESRSFLAFLERERRRAQLAVAYIEAQPIDPETKQDLLDTLAIEIRFFSRLLEEARPSDQPRPPGAEFVPLLFVSLPPSLATAPSHR